MNVAEPMTWDDGIHKLEWEPPDIFHIHVNGVVSMDEANMSYRVVDEEILPACNGELYFVIHVAPGAPGYSPEVRKSMLSRPSRHKGIVVIGGSPIVRASANVIFRAMRLLNLMKVPTQMTETVEEMYAVINRWRAAEKAGAAKS